MKLKERVEALLSGLRSADAEEEDQEQKQEQLPSESDTEAGEETAEDEDDGVDEVLEQVTLALETLTTQFTELVEAVRGLDRVAQEHDGMIQGLAQNEAARLKDVMDNGHWSKSLWVATRDAQTMDEGDTLEQVQQAPAQGSGGLLDSVMNRS